MKVKINIEKPSKIGRNIDAVQRAIDGKKKALDDILLIDVKNILVGIREAAKKKC